MLSHSKKEKIEELKNGIEYLEKIIPKIRKKEITYYEASHAVAFFRDLYKKFYGKYPQGLREELQRIYGKSA